MLACCCCCATGFSLSRALQLGLPDHVAAIEEVSEYASKVRRSRGVSAASAYMHA